MVGKIILFMDGLFSVLGMFSPRITTVL